MIMYFSLRQWWHVGLKPFPILSLKVSPVALFILIFLLVSVAVVFANSPSHGAVRQLGLLSLFILIFRLKKDDIHICGLIQLN